MEIKMDRKELLKAVSRVQSIIEKRSNMPILATILLNASGGNLYLSATDLEIGLQERLDAQVIEEGSVTVLGRKLYEILRESKRPEFTIKEQENNRLFLSDEMADFNLASLAPDEFPALVEPEDVTTVEIQGELLNEMISKTIHSVALEEVGFKLSGIFVQRLSRQGKTFLRFVGTDGHRLSLIDKPINGVEVLDLDRGVLVPRKGMMELNKLASEGDTIEVGLKGSNCVARSRDITLIIRLLESKFPDYEKVIPKETRNIVKLDRLSLLEGMRKMVILSSENYRSVKVTIEKDSIELVSSNPDLGEGREKISASYEGELIEMAYNPRYFIDVLHAMESEVVELHFVDNSKPCLIRGEGDEGFLGFIMPMRV